MNFGKSLARQLLELSISVAVAVLVLRWAWQAVQPLLPVLVGAVVLIVGLRLAVSRFRQW